MCTANTRYECCLNEFNRYRLFRKPPPAEMKTGAADITDVEKYGKVRGDRYINVVGS